MRVQQSPSLYGLPKGGDHAWDRWLLFHVSFSTLVSKCLMSAGVGQFSTNSHIACGFISAVPWELSKIIQHCFTGTCAIKWLALFQDYVTVVLYALITAVKLMVSNLPAGPYSDAWISQGLSYLGTGFFPDYVTRPGRNSEPSYS